MAYSLHRLQRRGKLRVDQSCRQPLSSPGSLLYHEHGQSRERAGGETEGGREVRRKGVKGNNNCTIGLDYHRYLTTSRYGHRDERTMEKAANAEKRQANLRA